MSSHNIRFHVEIRKILFYLKLNLYSQNSYASCQEGIVRPEFFIFRFTGDFLKKLLSGGKNKNKKCEKAWVNEIK